MNENDILTLIGNRRSVRQYTEKEVEKDKIEKCIEAVRLAPSACNAQPWKFIIVDDKELKNKIANAAESNVLGMNKFVIQAPIIIVAVRENPNITSKIGMILKNKPYTTIDMGIAAAHFCLCAKSVGLGTCIIGWFDDKKVKKVLGVPNNKHIEYLITLGYPKEELSYNKIRKTTEDICSYNKYR